MDRKQTVGVVAGAVLLALLVMPRVLPSKLAIPLTLEFVGYSFDAETGTAFVELKGKNQTNRSLRCEVSQFEYLDSNHRWKPVPPSSSQKSIPFAARESKSVRMELPEEVANRSWRIGMGCVIYPSVADQYLARALTFLKFRTTDRSPSVFTLQSEDFPPTNLSVSSVVSPN